MQINHSGQSIKITKENKQKEFTKKLWVTIHSNYTLFLSFLFQVQSCLSIPEHFSIKSFWPSRETVMHLLVFTCTTVLSWKENHLYFSINTQCKTYPLTHVKLFPSISIFPKPVQTKQPQPWFTKLKLWQ